MKRFFAICLIFLATVLLFPTTEAFAISSILTEEELRINNEKVLMEKLRIYDFADLLTGEELVELNDFLYAKGVAAGADIMVVTTYDMDGVSDKQYLEDFTDYMYFVEQTLAQTSEIMLINMEDRIVTLQGYGDAEFWINNDRTEYILDYVYEYLTDGDYYGAIKSFAKQVEYYMNEDSGVSTSYKPGQDYGEAYEEGTHYYQEPFSERYTKGEFIALRLREILFGTIIVSVIVSLIISGIISSRNKPVNTVTPSTYLDEANSGLTAQQDNYLRTTLTKIHKPTETSSSGGRSSGGGGRSSGGRSHSGGSRRF